MKITVLVDGNEFFEYASVFHTIDCDRSAGSFSVECGVLFVHTERGLFVGDPYDEDSYRVEEIESLPGDAHRALLDSGDVLNIQCENPLDSYIFQQLQTSFSQPEGNEVFDSITVVFSPDGLSSCDVYRDPDSGDLMERNFALSLHVGSSEGTRRLRLSEFGNVLHNHEEVSSIDFVESSLVCHLTNGATVERELKLAGFLTKIIKDLQEICRNPA
ncbi:hypothetical protein CMUST_10585 [Corynebacterium mustelae]|uniref:Uncharacterized protein n=1 Tax=Corynebacterium mustelae TaxID=571915 RepID=A0A0G3H3M5_9CORY|nr:hypothetical protein [Corynebacterium mustelae]AKK06433.1 hypothetical protein CMUST_10585 [Corynebacterium mustelae]